MWYYVNVFVAGSALRAGGTTDTRCMMRGLYNLQRKRERLPEPGGTSNNHSQQTDCMLNEKWHVRPIVLFNPLSSFLFLSDSSILELLLLI